MLQSDSLQQEPSQLHTWLHTHTHTCNQRGTRRAELRKAPQRPQTETLKGDGHPPGPGQHFLTLSKVGLSYQGTRSRMIYDRRGWPGPSARPWGGTKHSHHRLLEGIPLAQDTASAVICCPLHLSSGPHAPCQVLTGWGATDMRARGLCLAGN